MPVAMKSEDWKNRRIAAAVGPDGDPKAVLDKLQQQAESGS